MAEQQKGAVLITGTSTGIGRACAMVLDRSGYQVFAGVRKVESIGQFKKGGFREPHACDPRHNGCRADR